MTHICILALPGTLGSSLSLPLEMLNAADEQLRLSRRKSGITLEIVGVDAGTITAAGGLGLCVDRPYREIRRTDLIVIPTRWRRPLRPVADQPHLLRWLQRMVAGGAHICTGGTGSFLVAEAGLLDGRPATTHWHYFEEFAARFPAVDLKTQYLITEADGLYCAGSVNAMADMMVHLIGEYWGTTVAHRVERQFSPEIRRPFHSHAYRVGHDRLHRDEAIAFAQSWLIKNLQQPIGNADLVRVAGLSERSFHRRFRQATGKTPLRYLRELRLDSARDLLRNSNLSVEEIAQEVGYADTSYFCRLFRQHSGQTPAEYRRAVRAKLFSVED